MHKNLIATVILALLVVGGGAFALGAVHANRNDKALEASAMQKQKTEDAAMVKTAEDAAMKQAESGTMAQQGNSDAMQSGDTPATSDAMSH